MSQNNQRKHYHIHAPYQHPQQQQQQQQQQTHHQTHHLTPSQQQQQQHQQWYSQQHYQHGLHLRDSRHMQHPQLHHHHQHQTQQQQHQQPHQNHTMPPHMFTSGYVGIPASAGVVSGGNAVGGGVGSSSSALNAATMSGTAHNMPASSSSAQHYSSSLLSGSSVGGGVGSNVASSSNTAAYVSRNRIFDLEMLTSQQQQSQHSSSASAHSHTMSASGSSSGRAAGFDAYSHNSLYSQQNQRHLSAAPISSHQHLATHHTAPLSLHPHHHLHQQPQPQPSLHHHQHQQQQQHYYHRAQQNSLQRPHSQIIPPLLHHIKSEPVEQITVTPSIQTEEVIIKSEPLDDIGYHQKIAPQIENKSFYLEEKGKQHELLQQQQQQQRQHQQQQQRAQHQKLHEQQQMHQHHELQQIKQEHYHHHTQSEHNQDVFQQNTNSENSSTIIQSSVRAAVDEKQLQQHQLQHQQRQQQQHQQPQISLANIKTEAKPLNFPRRKLQTERSSTLPICQRCKQVFLKRQNYTQHVALSSCNIVEYDFKCSVCPMSFMSNEELQTHELLHLSNRFFCQKYCGKFYDSIDECEQHEYGQHEYEMFKCNICCISVTERNQLVAHLNEHKYQPRFDCCICRLCFQTSLELHDHYINNEDFCGKFYDKEAFKKPITSSASPYLSKPESSNLEIAHSFSLKDIPPANSHHLEALYAKPSTSKMSMEPPNTPTPTTPLSSSFSTTVNEFAAIEPHIEVKTEIKVEPDFYPPMDQSDFANYDNDYATSDYTSSSNQNLAFLHDYQDNASSSTNSSYSFNNNDAIQDEEAICCVPKCGVRKLSSPSLQFFSFPREEKYLSQWLHNLKMVYDPNINYSLYRICSLHFPKRCIAKYSLSYWAVPTFNLGHDDVGNLYQNRESSGGFPGGEMAKCSMPGCPSQRGETNVKFHVFPRDLKTLIKWCQNSRLPVHSKDNRFFCSRHFEEKCFGKFRLKPWAIPTLNLGTVYGKIHDNPNIYQEEKKCFLPFCRRSRSYDCNLSLYRFPRDEVLLRRWCYNLRLDPNLYRGKNHKICSSHFIKEALGLRKLNPGAVPTLNLGHNDRFNIYENELYTPPPPPPPPQPSTSSKAHKFAQLFKQEIDGSSAAHIYDGVFRNSMVQKFSSASSNSSSNNLDLGDVCLVPSCKRTRHSDDISLHTVPKRPEQLKKWCHNLKMDLVKMHKSVRICSAHFEKYCIGGCMRPFAVPTLELGHDDTNIFRNPDVIKKLNIRETCCIQSCKRNRDRDHANLHRFPTHPELLQKWCENLQKLVPDGTKLFNDAVCEVHFEERCLRNKRLEKWAIPTLNLGWDEAPHSLPSEEEINENWVKPFAPNNGDEQGECCVVSCKRNPQIDDVRLYRPPEDAEQLVKWAHNLQVDVAELPNMKICNLHFEQHCIGKRLLNWAMPTLNLGGKVEHLFENPPPMPAIYKKKIKPDRILSNQDGLKWSPRCCLPHCRKMRSVDKIHLFRFPYNNRQTLAKWCHNLQLPLVGSSHRRICSSHFEASVLTKRCPMTLAVPTLDLNAPQGYKIYQNPARLKQIKLGAQRHCVIESCRKTKLDGVTLFRFPNNRSILYRWRHNIKNWPKGKLSSQMRICSEHFEPHSVGVKKLSPGAIPTLKLGHEAKDLYPNETRSFFDLEKCAVSDCDSRKEMEDIRLFRFPRDDDEVLRKWCNNLKMNPNDCVGIKICSKHFELECIGPRQLYKWSIPTLNLGLKETDSVEIIPNPPPEQRTGEFLFKCCVPSCGKTRKYDEAQMNSFPKNLKLFRKWKHNLKLDFLNFKEREKYKICNDHFEPVCVGKTRLNFGALPTLNLGHDEVDDLYQINPDRIRPNLFIKQKHVEKLERKRIIREENEEQFDCEDQDEDVADPLGLETTDVKCCVTECSAPKSIMREPYDLPESSELKQMWLKEIEKTEGEYSQREAKICGLHYQLIYKKLESQMLEAIEKNESLKSDFNKQQCNFQKSNISLVINSYQCRVQECNTNLLNSSIRLYFFPYGKHLVTKWSHNTGIIPDESRRYMNKVCALHFESYCITENHRLRPWAIPTLNLPASEEEKKHLYKNPDLTKIDRRMLGPQILKCAVNNCSYLKMIEDESLKLFNFPSDDELLKKWCDNLKMSHHFTPLLKICSLHFEKICFGSCRIRSWAIPTLNLGHNEAPEHINKTTIRQEVYDATENISEVQLKQVKIKKSLDSAKCYVAGCRKSRLKHGVRFYILPSNSKVRRKWLHNLQISSLKVTNKVQNIKICNLHFHKRCFEGKLLKTWAVPTKRLGHSEAVFDNPRKVRVLPPLRCVLAHCKNHSGSNVVRTFALPKAPELLEKWCKNFKFEVDKCKGRVCHEHFEKDVKGAKKLKSSAVPTLDLGHDDTEIYDNTELIEKLKFKQIEKDIKQDSCTVKMADEDNLDLGEEHEQHTEDEEEEIWESEEGDEEEEDEDEQIYYDDEEDEEDHNLNKDEDKEETQQDDDEISMTNSTSDWSSIKLKELRVSVTPLTPEDLMDLCSRSSYEREFGSLTPANSIRGRRSVTPASSWKDLRPETPDQKLYNFNFANRSETPDKRAFHSFREPRSVSPEQKTGNFREPRSPERKSVSPQDPLSETLHDICPKTQNMIESLVFPVALKSDVDSSVNTLKRENSHTNKESGMLKKERLEITEAESTHISLPNDGVNSLTNLRTDKALNAVAPICCLKHCGKEKTPEQHLTTYGFPKDAHLLQKWCDNLGLKPEECIGRVCIDHFELRVIGARRLKLGAVPTLNLGPNCMALHTNMEDTTQKKSVTKEFSETGNMQETDSSLRPPPPYKTPKPGKQSVFRLCCLKHCRRKKFIKEEKKELKEQEREEMVCLETKPEVLFKFPTEQNILKKWNKNLRLPENLNITTDLQICSQHFESSVIKNDQLHPDAVPTLQLSYANRKPIYTNGCNLKTPRKSKVKCCLPHCGNNVSNNITLLAFPENNPVILKKWCRNLKLNFKEGEYKNLKICSEHFEPYVFYKKIYLRLGALPTLNLGHTDAIIRNCRKLRLRKEINNSVKDKCCIAECQAADLKLYSFPRSSELRKIWCNNLKIELRQALNNHYKVCARHFTTDSLMAGTDNLKINAVPVLNLGLNNDESHLLLATNSDESKCVVENCQKTTSVDKVRLFKFPKKQDLLEKWLFNLNLSAATFNPLDVVCSKHFDKICIKNGVLHENAIPTRFLELSHKGWFYKNNEDLYDLPRKCCVLNCQQTSEEAKHLYKFPKHKEDLEKWLYNLKLLVEETDVKDLRVCDRHFEQSCKISNKDLITQALPTLNLGHNDADIYGNNFIKCCLNNCTMEGFYYHKLPEDLLLQSYWFQELEMETTYNTSLYICSVHFVVFFERILEKYSAFLKESKEYVKLSVTYNELKALPALQCYKCHVSKCNSGFKLIWKLFKFPKDFTLFNKWLHNTGLHIDYDQRHTYRICARHFEERCLSEKKLHRWSLPTLQLPFNNSLYVNPPEALPSNHENLKHCCVSNCPTEKGPFYKFPLKQLDVKKWIHNLDLGPQQCTLNLRVCFKHFESYCFSKAINKVKPLKFWSVPTLKLKRKIALFLNPADKVAFYVCCITSCRQILNKSKEIYLFKFPFSNTLKEKWLHNLNLSLLDYKETMRICSAHFERECFLKGFKLLRKYSVPTLGLAKPNDELYRNPVRRSCLRCCVKMCEGPWEKLLNFPKNKILLRKWSHNLQLHKEIKLESLRDWKICQRHFEQQCLNEFGTIKSMAVPTLKLGHRKKLFKNPSYTFKSNNKKNQVKIEHGGNNIKYEVYEKDKQKNEIQLDTVSQEVVNIKTESKLTNPLHLQSAIVKKLRPLRAKTLNVKKQQKAKIITKRRVGNTNLNTKDIKETRRVIKSKQFKSEKELETLTEFTHVTKDESEHTLVLQQLNTTKKTTTNLTEPIKNEENQRTTNYMEEVNIASNSPEEVYLENLLEILTESLPANEGLFKQEPVRDLQREILNYVPDNKNTEKPHIFTITEIKQEIGNEEVNKRPSLEEEYLEKRLDYEPSEPGSVHEERDKSLTKRKTAFFCSIKNCKNWDSLNPELPLFPLPKIRELRDYWVANCKLKQRQYSASGVFLKRFRVCIAHFDKACIKENNRLLIGAVPSLDLGRKRQIVDFKKILQKFSYLRCRVQTCQRSCQYDTINRITFPQNEMKIRWCSILNIKEEDITFQDWICHRHFERQALIDCRKIKPDAVPALLLDEVEVNANDNYVAREIKPKCLYPLCKENYPVLYDWPDNDIFGLLWRVVKKLGRHVDDNNAWKQMFEHTLLNEHFNESAENNLEQHIKLCDEHFYYLYKTNEKTIYEAVMTEDHKKLKQKVQLTFYYLNTLEKIYIKQCAVPQCKTDQNIKMGKTLKLFSFPLDPDMAQKWCYNIGLEYSCLETKPFIKICEIHFENFCFQRRNLFEGALPTLNLPAKKGNSLNIIQNDTAKLFGAAEKCCIKTCPNAQFLKPQTHIKLYRFPKDPAMLKKWLENTNCEETFEAAETRICGLHFQASDIIAKKTALKEQAIPKYFLDPITNYLNSSPNSSFIDEHIQVKQELDNFEEWCNAAPSLTQEDSFTLENSHLKPQQACENISELKLKEDSNREQQDFPQHLIEIKQEIIEIQEQQPQTSSSLFSIHKFEEPTKTDDFQYSANNQPAAFVISDVKSQVYLCCVQKCCNNSETKGVRIFNEFPRDSEIFIKWCFNLKIDPRNYKENQYAICEQHFEPICFTDTGLLQAWSVPTLNLNLNENSFIHQNDVPDHLKSCNNDQCIVYGCINPLKPLFRFPHNPDISLKWFSNLKLDYTDFRSQNYRICRRHFVAHLCFELNDLNKLKSEAVPTQFLGHTDKIFHFNNGEEQDVMAGGHDNSRGSSQGSLNRIISPNDLEDHDSSYFEDFEEYYGQDE